MRPLEDSKKLWRYAHASVVICMNVYVVCFILEVNSIVDIYFVSAELAKLFGLVSVPNPKRPS